MRMPLHFVLAVLIMTPGTMTRGAAIAFQEFHQRPDCEAAQALIQQQADNIVAMCLPKTVQTKD